MYWYFVRWEQAKTTEKILPVVRAQLRLQEGRDAEPSAGLIDSQTVKGAATVGRDTRGYDAGKKINGRKRFIVTDTLGLLLTVVVLTAGVQDRDGAKPVLLETYCMSCPCQTTRCGRRSGGRFDFSSASRACPSSTKSLTGSPHGSAGTSRPLPAGTGRTTTTTPSSPRPSVHSSMRSARREGSYFARWRAGPGRSNGEPARLGVPRRAGFQKPPSISVPGHDHGRVATSALPTAFAGVVGC